MANEYLKAALYGIKRFNECAKRAIPTEKLLDLVCKYLEDFKIFTEVKSIGYVKEEGMFIRFCAEYISDDGTECTTYLPVEEVFGKNFGFIQRLVENEKIDLTAYGSYALVDEGSEGKYIQLRAYETILMLLSIQDDPVIFLASILK